MSIDLKGMIGFEYGSVVRKDLSVQELQNQQATQVRLLPDESKDQVARIDTVEESSGKEFSFNLKRGKEYNLIGASSKIEDLDVTKAMSDIRKDSVLDQYKFFVKTDVVNNEDGIVRRVIR